MSWPIVKLGDVVTIKGGGTPDKSVPAYWDGDIPWASVKDFKSYELSRTVDYITIEGVNASATQVIPAGNIIVPTRMAVGKVAINTVDIAINQDLKAIFVSRHIDREFLLHALLAKAEILQNQATGATVKGIKVEVLKNLEIPLPPLEEQKRIAGILDQADALRRLRVRALEKLNTLGQAVFQEMFGTWDKISPYPTSSLGRILDFLTSGSRGWGKYYSDGGAKFIRIQNVKRDEFSFEDIAYVNPPRSSEAVRTRVYKNDVLLSITADLGRSSVVPDGVGEAYINQHLAILRTSKLNPVFLSSLMSSPSGQRMISRGNKEGVKAGLNFDDIRSMQIIEPPKDVQIEFSDRKKAVEDLIEIARDLLKQADSLFASLQSAAFQGKL